MFYENTLKKTPTTVTECCLNEKVFAQYTLVQMRKYCNIITKNVITDSFFCYYLYFNYSYILIHKLKVKLFYLQIWFCNT